MHTPLDVMPVLRTKTHHCGRYINNAPLTINHVISIMFPCHGIALKVIPFPSLYVEAPTVKAPLLLVAHVAGCRGRPEPQKPEQALSNPQLVVCWVPIPETWLPRRGAERGHAVLTYPVAVASRRYRMHFHSAISLPIKPRTAASSTDTDFRNRR